jgi:hypothetical protein
MTTINKSETKYNYINIYFLAINHLLAVFGIYYIFHCNSYKTFRNKLSKNNKFKKSNKIKKNNKSNKINKSKKNKPQFLYNPDDPSKSFDVYIDKNPKDTISIKYKTLEDVKNTILKLEKLYKTNKYSHKRIWQVGMIMYVRLKVLKNKKPKEYKLSLKYFKFLGKRTNIKNDLERKKLLFKF